MLHQTSIAFIGGGHMATAMIRGLLAANHPATAIRVSDPDPQRCDLLRRHYPAISVVQENQAIVSGANVVVLAVKPEKIATVVRDVMFVLMAGTLVLSIAAGISLATLRALLPSTQPVVRVMPNTPALIGAGISALLPAPDLSEVNRRLARDVMAVAGDVVEIDDESLMDGITALSGSGPAYLFLVAEALSDGGVACGLPRTLADRLAIKTLIGAARLVDEGGTHPAVLKNQVTSPGGTTIAGLEQLEKAGVRGALMAAVKAAWQRSRDLSRS